MSNFISNNLKKLQMFMVAFTTAIIMSPATQCVTVNPNMSTTTVLGSVVSVVLDIAKYVGIVLAISGVFQLILAYKDDDSNGQSRAIRLTVVGAALMGLGFILQSAGLISGV